jgi:hypothetical protein
VADDLRLYGPPDAEHLWSDKQSAIEAYVDEMYDAKPGDTFVIVEHSTMSARQHYHDADYYLERIHEDACDDWGDDGLHDAIEAAITAEVRAKMSEVLDLIWSKVHYQFADAELRRFTVQITKIDEHGIVDWSEVTDAGPSD